MRILGIVLVVIGISLLGYSWTLEPYTNQQEFEKEYFSLEGEDRSEKFYKLRNSYLTNKYTLENYGVTILVLGTFVVLLLFKGWNSFRIPRSKLLIGLVGLMAAIMTVFGFAGDLYLEMYRGSYPHWADSIGIPLASLPSLFIVLLIWFGLNLIGLRDPFRGGELVKNLTLDHINYWYLIILILTIILTGVSVSEGYFWFCIAGVLWSYYYLSILVGRQRGNIVRKKMTKGITEV